MVVETKTSERDKEILIEHLKSINTPTHLIFCSFSIEYFCLFCVRVCVCVCAISVGTTWDRFVFFCDLNFFSLTTFFSVTIISLIRFPQEKTWKI